MSVRVEALESIEAGGISNGSYFLVVLPTNEGRKSTFQNIRNQIAADGTTASFGGTLASGTDLDTITTAGVYAIAGNYTYTNLPTGITWGILEVTKPSKSASIYFQTLTNGSGRTFKRTHTNNTPNWSAWQELVRSSAGMTLRGTSSTSSVTFSTAFASAPTVVCTPVASSNQPPSVIVLTSITASGFEVSRTNWDSTASDMSYNWIAIGTPTS